MRRADRARAELDVLWASVFKLYAFRPAIGALGAEEVVYRDPAEAQSAISCARESLQDLGVPTA